MRSKGSIAASGTVQRSSTMVLSVKARDVSDTQKAGLLEVLNMNELSPSP